MNVPDLLANLRRRLPLLKVPKYLLLSVLLFALAAAALIEFCVSGLARRTFVFYDFDSGVVSVEDRMMPVSGGKPSSREVNITRYVEEALLGPVNPNSMPLFPVETRLISLFYRDGIVYADFSEEAVLPPVFPAALPPAEGGEVLKNFKTLYAGIKRNFSFVNDVRFFITGRAVFWEEFKI